MPSRPLLVAGAATALLVVVLAADLTMNRAYRLEVHAGSGWRTLVEEPFRPDRSRFAFGPGGEIEVNRSDDVRFRIALDNGFPFGADRSYRVFLSGDEVASGTLSVPARADGAAEFALQADALLGRPAAGVTEPQRTSAHVTVEIGRERLGPAYVPLREVAR